MARLHPNDRGVKHIFGKRYMWLLSPEGKLGLHKVDDRGDDASKDKLAELLAKQEEQS